MGYTYKKLDAPEDVALHELSQSSPEEDLKPEKSSKKTALQRHPKASVAVFTMIATLLLLIAAFTVVRAGLLDFVKRQATTAGSTSSEVPQYFQTTPELFAGNLTSPRDQSKQEQTDMHRTYRDWQSTFSG